jgi:hypothetical protein
MRGVVLACLLSAAGCAPEPYVLYAPVPRAAREQGAGPPSSLSGYPAARYALPPDDPRGDVVIASFGVVWVDAPGYAMVRAVHARLVVENARDTDPWELDTRELAAVFPAGAKVAAALVNATAAGLPVLKIPPGREVATDAYFLVPRSWIERSLPGFELSWRVKTPDRAIEEHTRFALVSEPAATAASRFGYGLGFAPYWWFEPQFFHPRLFDSRPPRIFVASPERR